MNVTRKSTIFRISKIPKTYSYTYYIPLPYEKKIKKKSEFPRCPDLLVACQLPKYPTMLSLKQTY